MEDFIKVQIQDLEILQKELLPEALAEIGYYAFEENGNFLDAYIIAKEYDETLIRSVLKGMATFKIETVAMENWNAQWESNFLPIKIDSFAAVRASFHEAIPGVKHDLIITPRMSFGTGHHATTYLMLRELQHINFEGKHVIDFGAGTGVLAILAEKSGARNVKAIDSDTWSINNMNENIRENGCSKIEIIQSDTIVGEATADVILANINLNVLCAAEQAIFKALKVGGTLLISGFFKSDISALNNIFTDRRYSQLKVVVQEKWAAVLYSKVV